MTTPEWKINTAFDSVGLTSGPKKASPRRENVGRLTGIRNAHWYNSRHAFSYRPPYQIIPDQSSRPSPAQSNTDSQEVVQIAAALDLHVP